MIFKKNKKEELNIELLKIQIYNEIKLDMVKELTKYKLEIRDINVLWSPYKWIGIYLENLEINRICYNQYISNSNYIQQKREEAIKELLKIIDKKVIIKTSKKQDEINKIKKEYDEKIAKLNIREVEE